MISFSLTCSVLLEQALVGNKVDLVDERQVSEAEGQALADKYKIPFIETSAKTAYNITEAFAKLIRVTPRRGIDYKVNYTT